VNPLRRINKQLPSEFDFIRQQMEQGVAVTLAIARYQEHKNLELWANDRYLVQLHRNYQGEMNPNPPPRTMLAVRLISGEPFGNWADLQEIKNQLLGPEAELVQLLPAESRKMDMVNMYWFYDNAGAQFPFGSRRREVANG
jgi:hypothetical protein